MIVIGAGASLAEALDHKPVRDREHPPLDATFFQRVKKYRASPLLERIEKQATALGIPDLAGSSPATRLESTCGDTISRSVTTRLRRVRAYFEAIELYASEITVTTNWMMGRSGLIKKVTRRSCAQAAGSASSASIATCWPRTRSACSAQSSGVRLVPDWCLWLQEAIADTCRPGRRIRRPVPQRRASGRNPLYRMHGSINWVFKHRDRYPPADLVTKERELYLLNHQKLPQNRVLRIRPGAGRPWYSFPLIVPPVYEKHAFIRRHLQEVWDGGTAALESATRVLFWGYRFPLPIPTVAIFPSSGSEERGPPAASRHRSRPAAGPVTWEVLQPTRVEQFRSAQEYLQSSGG